MRHTLSSRSIEIDAPVTAVFDYAANLENFSAWFPGVLSIRAINTGGIDRVGKTYEELVRVPLGKPATVRIQVVEAEASVRLVTEGDYRVLLPRMEMDFKAIDGNRTRIDWRMLSRRRGITAALMRPLLRIVLGSRSRHALARLKSTLERTSTSED